MPGMLMMIPFITCNVQAMYSKCHSSTDGNNFIQIVGSLMEMFLSCGCVYQNILCSTPKVRLYGDLNGLILILRNIAPGFISSKVQCQDKRLGLGLQVRVYRVSLRLGYNVLHVYSTAKNQRENRVVYIFLRKKTKSRCDFIHHK